ncbi:MAG TPA: hypothetical protein DCZ11_03210 [Gammaproteobacteria bacterium]|nr:hypothetical protein [Gammaproteobacteria bacterium]MCH77435.1 hypothetical protein [Gammaproteobacteria bacterium]
MLKRLTAFLAALLLFACASAPTPTGTLKAAYDSVATYQQLVGQTVTRGRITREQAHRLIDSGESVRVQIDRARDALALCGGKLPCDSYDEIIKRLQPMLADLERKLREEEAKK